VASVIGSTINNGYISTGVTNNVNIHALRVMSCGTGFLSDSARALDWAAGAEVEGVSPYEGKSGIINMSLSADTTSCPQFLQNSIDAAVAAGFTIVAAAGNDSRDVMGNSPASCDNVITVGAIGVNGTIADYSNTGSKVDIMARGSQMAVACEDSEVACYGSGTSFATPFVAAALAVVKQATGANDDVLRASVALSGKPVQDERCTSGICGAGIMDAAVVFEMALMANEGKLYRVEHALAGKTECDQQWYIDHFGNKAPLCDMHKVTFMGGYIKPGTSYKLLSIDEGDDWEYAYEIGEFKEGAVVLRELNYHSKLFGVRVCENGQCGDIEVMDITNITSPTVCD